MLSKAKRRLSKAFLPPPSDGSDGPLFMSNGVSVERHRGHTPTARGGPQHPPSARGPTSAPGGRTSQSGGTAGGAGTAGRASNESFHTGQTGASTSSAPPKMHIRITIGEHEIGTVEIDLFPGACPTHIETHTTAPNAIPSASSNGTPTAPATTASTPPASTPSASTPPPSTPYASTSPSSSSTATSPTPAGSAAAGPLGGTCTCENPHQARFIPTPASSPGVVTLRANVSPGAGAAAGAGAGAHPHGTALQAVATPDRTVGTFGHSAAANAQQTETLAAGSSGTAANGAEPAVASPSGNGPVGAGAGDGAGPAPASPGVNRPADAAACAAQGADGKCQTLAESKAVKSDLGTEGRWKTGVGAGVAKEPKWPGTP